MADACRTPWPRCRWRRGSAGPSRRCTRRALPRSVNDDLAAHALADVHRADVGEGARAREAHAERPLRAGLGVQAVECDVVFAVADVPCPRHAVATFDVQRARLETNALERHRVT